MEAIHWLGLLAGFEWLVCGLLTARFMSLKYDISWIEFPQLFLAIPFWPVGLIVLFLCDDGK